MSGREQRENGGLEVTFTFPTCLENEVDGDQGLECRLALRLCSVLHSWYVIRSFSAA